MSSLFLYRCNVSPRSSGVISVFICVHLRLFILRSHSIAPISTSPSQPVADPTRRAILARLAKGEATVRELAQPFEMTQPAVSRHLKVLESAGLITRRIEGSKRPCRLAKHGIEAVDRWLELLRRGLEASYDRLDNVLADMQSPKGRKNQ